MEAIVYTSNTGHAKEFALLLAKQLDTLCYNIEEAKTNLNKGVDIIYIGWIMAGQVKGLNKVLKYFNVKAICAVGMSNNDSQLKEIREKYEIQEGFPLFYLQGGFEYDKLHGIYKFMMGTIKNTILKQIEKKEDLTEEEKEMVNLIINGKNCVSLDKLTEVIEYSKKV